MTRSIRRGSGPCASTSAGAAGAPWPPCCRRRTRRDRAPAIGRVVRPGAPRFAHASGMLALFGMSPYPGPGVVLARAVERATGAAGETRSLFRHRRPGPRPSARSAARSRGPARRTALPRRARRALAEAALHDDVRGLVPPHATSSVVGFRARTSAWRGKGAGSPGERSGLWYEMLRVVGIVRPMFVVVRMSARWSRGLATVAEGLAGLGYAVEWQTITALSVGALHPLACVCRRAPDGQCWGVRDPGVVERTFAAHRAPAASGRRNLPGCLAPSRGRRWRPRCGAFEAQGPGQRRRATGGRGRGRVPPGRHRRPRAPVGWRAIGVVTDGEGADRADLF